MALKQIPPWVEYDLARYLTPAQHSHVLHCAADLLHNPPIWMAEQQMPAWTRQFLEGFQNDPALDKAGWLLDMWTQSHHTPFHQTCFLMDHDPLWMTELNEKRQSGVAHLFIVHFNVNDFVFDPRFGYRPLIEYLYELYSPKNGPHDLMIYNRSQGLIHAFHRFQPEEKQEQYSQWSRLVGLANDTSGNVHWRLDASPVLALQILETHLRTENNIVVLFEFSEKIAPAGSIEHQGTAGELLQQIETLQRWAVDSGLKERGHTIILLARNKAEVSSTLLETANGIEQIEIPLPDRLARQKYSAYLYYDLLRSGPEENKTSHEIQFDFEALSEIPEMALTSLADRTAGMSRVSILDLVRRSLQRKTPVTINQILDHKRNVLRGESGNLLKAIEPELGFKAVGGIDHLIDYLREDVISALGNSSRRKTVPAGILFLGPPGTGKSMVAKAIAKESGVNFVQLGNVRDMYIGQSERNLSRALGLIRAMAPVIVFIDELDQSEGARPDHSLDSGVGRRIFGQLLEFMSDDSLRGDVVWIAASNRPDLIDAAMKRSGRFDDKIPFLVPDDVGRMQIFHRLLLHKFKVEHFQENDLWPIAALDKCEGFTGAEIEVICARALRKQALDHAPSLTLEHLTYALDNFIPNYNQGQYEYMTLLALREVSDRRFTAKIGRYNEFFNHPEGLTEGLTRLNSRLDDLRRHMYSYRG